MIFREMYFENMTTENPSRILNRPHAMEFFSLIGGLKKHSKNLVTNARMFYFFFFGVFRRFLELNFFLKNIEMQKAALWGLLSILFKKEVYFFRMLLEITIF